MHGLFEIKPDPSGSASFPFKEKSEVADVNGFEDLLELLNLTSTEGVQASDLCCYDEDLDPVEVSPICCVYGSEQYSLCCDSEIIDSDTAEIDNQDLGDRAPMLGDFGYDAFDDGTAIATPVVDDGFPVDYTIAECGSSVSLEVLGRDSDDVFAVRGIDNIKFDSVSTNSQDCYKVVLLPDNSGGDLLNYYSSKGDSLQQFKVSNNYCGFEQEIAFADLIEGVGGTVSSFNKGHYYVDVKDVGRINILIDSSCCGGEISIVASNPEIMWLLAKQYRSFEDGMKEMGFQKVNLSMRKEGFPSENKLNKMHSMLNLASTVVDVVV